jgi:hypothetical protein
MASSTPPPGPAHTLADRVADVLGLDRVAPRPLGPVPWYGKAVTLSQHANGDPIAPWSCYATPADHGGIETIDQVTAWLAWGPRNPQWVSGDPANPFRLSRPASLRYRLFDPLAWAIDHATLAAPSDLFGRWWIVLWIVIAAWGVVAPPLLDPCDDLDGSRWGRVAWVFALAHAWRTLRRARMAS